MAHAGPGQSAPNAPVGDLGLLVATEQELETRLANAREQARTLIDAATAEAEARTLAQDQSVAESRARFEAEVERERTSRAAELLAEGRKRAARYDDLAGTRIAELAGVVIERLLGGGAR
jgi:hypothetical protein